MDKDEIPQIARELISQVVAEIPETLSLVFLQEDGSPILLVTAGDSVLRFNPQKSVEKIIADIAWHKDVMRDLQGDPEAQDRYVIRESKKKIIKLLFTVNLWLGEALWILEKLSQASMLDEEFGPFWKDVQAGVKWSTLSLIDARLRELLRLPEKDAVISLAEQGQLMSGKYNYAITDGQMLIALAKLPKFSIKKLAQLLEPEREDFRPSVYDWIRRKGITRKELEAQWRKLRSGVEKFD